MNDVRVAAVQFEHAAGDKAWNFRKIEALSARAAEQRASIVAFPECCITGCHTEPDAVEAEVRSDKPELYGPLIVPTGRERDMRSVRFDR